MTKYAYLVMVKPGENNNKFYEMKQVGNEIHLFNGRVGVSRVTQKPKPLSDWDKIYRSKTRKGYRDQTEHHAVIVPTNTQSSSKMGDIVHNSTIVRQIFQRLVDSSSLSVRTNYTVGATGVTQQMIDDAQGTLDSLANLSKAGDWGQFNNVLLDLFHIIPRKMGKVQHHLLELGSNEAKQSAEILENEQDILDSMKGMVVVVTNDDGQDDSAVHTIFDSMGISVVDCTPKEIAYIKRRMSRTQNDKSHDAVRRFHNAVAVVNAKTAKQFNEFVGNAQDQTTELYWHGSRTQNWISIMTSGLTVRPVGVHITGKMFGNGTYFADSAQKSIGYSSLRGSYWSGGSDHYGYLAMYEVHLGKKWNVHSHNSSHYNLDYRVMQNKGYDSLYAHGGADLRNDEIIVYHDGQSNIRYLVELR